MEKETIEMKKEGRILLDESILKEPNFKILKESLHLDDSVTSVYIYFNKYKANKPATK